MVEEINHDRRRFLATAMMTIVSAELGMIVLLPRNRARPNLHRCKAMVSVSGYLVAAGVCQGRRRCGSFLISEKIHSRALAVQ